MKKLILFLPFLLLADVNPFNAGNLNSPNPYGLTPQEKVILQNKKNILSNKKKLEQIKKELENFKSSLAQKFVQYDETISDLNDKLASFNTILSEIDATKIEVDNLKKHLKDQNSTIAQINQKISSLENNITKLQSQNEALKKSIEAITKIQNQNFQYLSNSIQTILNQLKKINTTTNISPKEAFTKAKKYFYKGMLNKAKNLFLISLNHNYMPATSSFYLGEIEYRHGNYKEALAFYKKSITLYPKKTYFTDNLLYHTAISFKKLGMEQNAKMTFKKLIQDFPGSKYAKLAKKELEK